MAANIEHVIVLMLENRSFDHMIGSLRSSYPEDKFAGLREDETNPDKNGQGVRVTRDATAVLSGGPDHTHEGVMRQLTGIKEPPPGAEISAQGFVLSYADKSGG